MKASRCVGTLMHNNMFQMKFNLTLSGVEDLQAVRIFSVLACGY